MSCIEIKNMEFYDFHGCFDEEAAIGTHFIVNVKMDVDTSRAQETDNIDDTVNYLSVYNSVKRQMGIPSHLLENVADRIAVNILSEYHAIRHISVKVSKLNPPLGGKIGEVSVTVEKSR